MTASIETSAQPMTGTRARRIDTARVAELYRQLLVELGEDPSRDGLRVLLAASPAGGASSSTMIPALPLRSSTSSRGDGDQLLVVSGINVYSLCEHHLLPMRLTVSVGYLPAGPLLGLSKFARIAHAHAHRSSCRSGSPKTSRWTWSRRPAAVM